MVSFNAVFSESRQFSASFIDPTILSASFTDISLLSADFGEVQIVHEADWYEGEYEITPSAQLQTLPTMYKAMLHDIVVKPIPNNYGLISWNGSILTVS